jgi:lambda family phage portal protein
MIFRALGAAKRAFRSTFSGMAGWAGWLGGYAAAQINRFTKWRRIRINHAENSIDPDQFPRMAADAWKIFRDNGHGRKIVRSLCSKVVGEEIQPRSQARDDNGQPLTEFRKRCRTLMEDWAAACDYRGTPGKGGSTWGELQKTALIACILSGETLFTMRAITEAEQKKRGLPVPLTLQLIDAQRFADGVNVGQIPAGHLIYRGIELDADRRRARYWLNNWLPNTFGPMELDVQPKPYSVDDIFHVFAEDDIDQYRGTTWFAALIEPNREAGDLKYNFVKTTAMQACIIMSYSLSTGKTRIGPNGEGGADLVDSAGNRIEQFTPGMAINTGKDGKVEMHSPTINVAGYEGLIQSVMRDEAAAVPGTKASTITGDYRQSSFSSERAADNDIWPEIEVLQSWFSSHMCQCVYEQVVRAAVAEGYFDGVEGFTRGKFLRNPTAFLRCKWQGPVQRSINPVDDVKAAALRVQKGFSDVPTECAKLGEVAEEVLHRSAEYRKAVIAAGLPEVYANNAMSMDVSDLVTAETTEANANGGSNVPAK